MEAPGAERVSVRPHGGDNSYDSRAFGPVPLESLKGVATAVHFSLSPTQGIRWARLGQSIS